MSLVNYSTREITSKIVYYGPGRSGKTTNLQALHALGDVADAPVVVTASPDWHPGIVGLVRHFAVEFVAIGSHRHEEHVHEGDYDSIPRTGFLQC